MDKLTVSFVGGGTSGRLCLDAVAASKYYQPTALADLRSEVSAELRKKYPDGCPPWVDGQALSSRNHWTDKEWGDRRIKASRNPVPQGWDILNAGIHWLNFAVNLNGQSPAHSVLAAYDKTTRTFRDGMQVETVAVTSVQMANGVRIVMQTGIGFFLVLGFRESGKVLRSSPSPFETAVRLSRGRPYSP